mgnify:CR=1 FL=1
MLDLGRLLEGELVRLLDVPCMLLLCLHWLILLLIVVRPLIGLLLPVLKNANFVVEVEVGALQS